MRARTRDAIVSGELTELVTDIDWGCVDKKMLPVLLSGEASDPDFLLDNIPYGTFGHYVSGILYPHWVTVTMLFVSSISLLAGVIYGMTTLCRRTVKGAPTFLYYKPNYLPWSVYVLLAVASLVQVLDVYVTSWLYLWPSLFLTLFILLLTSGALWKAVTALQRRRKMLKRLSRDADIGLTIALLHNSISFCVWWTLMLCIQKLSIILVYYLNVAMDTSGYICLGLALFIIVLLFCIENFYKYKSLRYIYGSYLAWMVVFIGMMQRNWNLHCGVTIMMVSVFGLLIAAFMIKICVFCFRNHRRNIRRNRKRSMGRREVSIIKPNIVHPTVVTASRGGMLLPVKPGAVPIMNGAVQLTPRSYTLH